MSRAQKAHFSSSLGHPAIMPCKIHPRSYFRLKSPNILSKAALSANKCSPSVMDSPLLAPIKIASASLNFFAIILRPFCLTALLRLTVVLSYDKVWDVFRGKQWIRSVFRRTQKIRTLPLSEKSSDFVVVVHLQGLEPWAH